jgi:hypothetical protein
MTLQEAIADHGRANLTETNDWYRWPVNPSFLPTGVFLPEGSYYAQNVALKQQLSVLYSSANTQVKIEITYYYISKWGGIKKNTDEKIRSYALDTPASLIAKGSQGIASWSKALCIRCPNDYAIYDARVALSLNCLQMVTAVDRPIIFPQLAGQNKRINKGSRTIRQYATKHGWMPEQQAHFYQKYNDILSAAAKLLDVNLYTLEMLLFAKAPELLQEAFPEEKL